MSQRPYQEPSSSLPAHAHALPRLATQPDMSPVPHFLALLSPLQVPSQPGT